MIALAWQDQSLSLLDQSRYPAEEAWIACPDVRATAAALSSGVVLDDKTAAIAGAYGYCLAALEAQTLLQTPEFDRALAGAKVLLLDSRPGCRALAQALDYMEHPPQAYTKNTDRLTTILATAVTYDRQCVVSARNICRNGAGLMGAGTRVLVRSDRGVFHSAAPTGAAGIVRRAWKREILERVCLCEGRPGLEGASLLAYELAVKNQVPCTVIPDHAAATLLARQGAHMVLTDGIRMAKNGDLMAPVGSYELAIACYFHSIPFYGVLYADDIDLHAEDGTVFGMAVGAPAAVSSFAGTRLVPDSADCWTPAYDIVPALLVTGVISDRAVAYPPYEETLEDLVTHAPKNVVINFDA